MLGFFLHMGAKILVAVGQILVLVAVAGQNIGNQRLRICDDQLILIGLPGDFSEIRGKDICAVFPAEALVQAVRGKDNALVKGLDQQADFPHVAGAVGAAKEPSPWI